MTNHRIRRMVCPGALVACLVAGSPAAAQSVGLDASTPDTLAPPTQVFTPADMVRRDAEGTTIRAVRISSPLTVDGALSDEVYRTVPPIDGFIQQEPDEGEPATERTEAWIFFDNRSIYIAARCHDSQPGRMVVNEMRRDNVNIHQNESFTVVFDTFHDKRNGFYFQTNPLGALRDGLVTDEGSPNFDWNTVWQPRAVRGESGWTLEMVIPFKSLRYGPGRTQVWGVNLRRTVRWKNEESYVTPIPASYGPPGVFKFSSAATLVGLETPSISRALEIKPYVISDLRTDRNATPAFTNDIGGDAGFDVKYGLSSGLVADLTYNTEFAQVEEDEQQVNLTRFNLFFPEKREFFLEGQGIFAFGGAVGRGGGGGGGNAQGGLGGVGRGQTMAPSLTPVLFFSRRIGLSAGQTVPIIAGGRVTGRVGDYTLGLVNIETGESKALDARATNFSVVRVRRDILRRSTIGVLATNRSPRLNGADTNQAFGVDANLAFYQNLVVKAYYARTETPGASGDPSSYLGELAYNGDRYGFVHQYLVVGDAFSPEVGFLRRSDLRRHYTGVRYSPRPRSIPSIRRMFYEANLDYVANGDYRLETREAQASISAEMQSGDRWQIEYSNHLEFLPEPFEIATGVTLPVGSYDFQVLRGGYTIGAQRRLSGSLTAGKGTFYDGTLTEAGYTGRVELTSRFSVEPRLTLNFVDLSVGSFTTTLVTTRTTFTFTPRTLLSALVQYSSSSDALSANIRFRWEYQPGSDLYVVYSEGRATDARGLPTLQNRGFVVKLTRLFRF